MSARGPYRVLTVNPSAENSQALVGLVLADPAVKDAYVIEHVGNCAEVGEVEGKVAKVKPDVLFVASAFEAEHSDEIQASATRGHAGVKTCVIPYGLQKEKGAAGVVEWVKGQLAEVLKE